MATIPTPNIYGTPQGRQQVIQQPRASYDDPGSDALRKIGQQLDEVRVRVEQSRDRTDLARAQLNATLEIDALTRELEQNADPYDIETEFRRRAPDILAKHAESLRSQEARQTWGLVSAQTLERGVLASRDVRDRRVIQNEQASLMQFVDEGLAIATDLNRDPAMRLAAQQSVLARLRSTNDFIMSADQRVAMELRFTNALKEFDKTQARAAKVQAAVDKYTDDKMDYGQGLAAIREEFGNDPEARAEAESAWTVSVQRQEQAKEQRLRTQVAWLTDGILLQGKSLDQMQRENGAFYATIRAENPALLNDLVQKQAADRSAAAARAEAARNRASEYALNSLVSGIYENPSGFTLTELMRKPEWGNLTGRDMAALAGMVGKSAVTGEDALKLANRIYSAMEAFDPLLRGTNAASKQAQQVARGVALRKAVEINATDVTNEGLLDLGRQLVQRDAGGFAGYERDAAYDRLLGAIEADPQLQALLDTVGPDRQRALAVVRSKLAEQLGRGPSDTEVVSFLKGLE